MLSSSTASPRHRVLRRADRGYRPRA
jgi:hypothetical protein